MTPARVGPAEPGATLRLEAPDGIGEIEPGTDLVTVVTAALDCRDGDVLVVTSKAVSKAEGRLERRAREEALEGQTVRVVARRGATTIVENPQGLVMAAAGLDSSNVPAGMVALLPADPDASARRLRDGLYAETGANVAVVVSDTAGRAWRTGQTDIAIGLAGLEPTEAFAGRQDRYGNPLVVTEPAVADEIAAAAELASSKLGGRPLVRVRGLAERVLPTGTHGSGARAMLRPRADDLFALGAREAVVSAVCGDQADAFGGPADAADLRAALARCHLATLARLGAVGEEAAGEAAPGQVEELALDEHDPVRVERARLVARAHGWELVGESPTWVLRVRSAPADPLR